MILNAIKDKRKAFKTVLIDSWYPTQRLMGLIDNSGKASHDTKKWEYFGNGVSANFSRIYSGLTQRHHI